MALRIIDKVYFQHIKSLDIDESLHKYKSYQFLSYRMYKYYHYAHQTNVGSYTADFSEKALLCAYILGKRDIERRTNSKFVVADTLLESDIMFYDSLWDIIAELWTEYKFAPMQPLSHKDMTTQDYTLTTSDVLAAFEQYTTYCQINGYEHETEIELIKSFSHNHFSWHVLDKIYHKYISKLLFKFLEWNHDAKPEPYSGFWLEMAQKAWCARQQAHKKDLPACLVFHSNYTNGHRLYQQYFKDL